MGVSVDATLLRWASLLMLAGGISFWIGAFIPPYKQWMTSDTREYLTIIHEHKLNKTISILPLLPHRKS